MSEVDARFVKRGLWTNLAQGNIMGKTITTDSTTGAIIIALMAVLSTMGRGRPSSCIDRLPTRYRNITSVECPTFLVSPSPGQRTSCRWTLPPTTSPTTNFATTKLVDG
jgi:hypothetical protein